MYEYFKSLLSSKDEASSKRFISLYSLLLYTIVLIIVLIGIFIKIIPADVIETIITSLILLITGQQLMTLFTRKDNQYSSYNTPQSYQPTTPITQPKTEEEKMPDNI